jgi:hypothetical protein
VHVQAKAKDAERVFGVTINDYTYRNRTFHSNDRNLLVPSNLSISAIDGLSNYLIPYKRQLHQDRRGEGQSRLRAKTLQSRHREHRRQLLSITTRSHPVIGRE